MTSRKQRKERRSRSGPSTVELLRASLKTYVSALPAIATVALAGAIPLNLALTWLMERQGIAGDRLWELRYQGLADLILGSLIGPAVYLAIHRVIARGPPRTAELPRVLGWAYKRAVGVWIGMFLTRLMVSFAVMIPALPLLGGLYLINRRFPELSALATDPAAAPIRPEMVLWLLLLVPLLVPPMYYYLRFILAEVVVSLERTDGFEAMQRSRALTRGVKWKVLLGLTALEVPIFLLGLALEAIGDGINPWAGALGTAASALLLALSGTFLVQVYLSQSGDAQDRRKVTQEAAT